MRKGIIAACLAAAATVLSPVAGECAEGFDCVQYIYGTWGVPHSDDIISFDYEGEVVYPEPGAPRGQEPPNIRFPYTGIENAYVNDTTHRGQLDVFTTVSANRTMRIEVLGDKAIRVTYLYANGDRSKGLIYYRMSKKAISDDPDRPVVNK